jgi:hypothetical protein
MEFDFSGLCADQLEKLKKRLESLNKASIKEYNIALNVINNPEQYEHRGEIMIGVEDQLRDVVKKCEIFYTEAMNKVQRELSKFL